MAHTIPLTQGKVAIVDDEDYGVLSQFKWFAQTNHKGDIWYARRYVYRGIMNGKVKLELVSMHRQILGLQKGDKTEGDHQNGDGLDNRRENLRRGTGTQNRWNRHRRSQFSSRYKGVKWSASKGKWEVNIGYNTRRIYLGAFSDEAWAAVIYNLAAIIYHGEFASLNDL